MKRERNSTVLLDLKGRGPYCSDRIFSGQYFTSGAFQGMVPVRWIVKSSERYSSNARYRPNEVRLGDFASKIRYLNVVKSTTTRVAAKQHF